MACIDHLVSLSPAQEDDFVSFLMDASKLAILAAVISEHQALHSDSVLIDRSGLTSQSSNEKLWAENNGSALSRETVRLSVGPEVVRPTHNYTCNTAHTMNFQG